MTSLHGPNEDRSDPDLSNEGRESDPSTSEDQAEAPRGAGRPWLSRWLLAGTFVVGVIVGIVVVGLLSLSAPEFLSANQREASPSPTKFNPVEVSAEVRVNAACLRVINEAQDMYAALNGVDQAVTDVNLKQLDDIVRQLQPVQPRLERDLRDCRVDATADNPSGIPSASTQLPPSSTPAPTNGAPLPTPAPTATG